MARLRLLLLKAALLVRLSRPEMPPENLLKYSEV